jgi:hypothetical protein
VVGETFIAPQDVIMKILLPRCVGIFRKPVTRELLEERTTPQVSEESAKPWIIICKCSGMKQYTGTTQSLRAALSPRMFVNVVTMLEFVKTGRPFTTHAVMETETSPV